MKKLRKIFDKDRTAKCAISYKQIYDKDYKMYLSDDYYFGNMQDSSFYAFIEAIFDCLPKSFEYVQLTVDVDTDLIASNKLINVYLRDISWGVEVIVEAKEESPKFAIHTAAVTAAKLFTDLNDWFDIYVPIIEVKEVDEATV